MSFDAERQVLEAYFAANFTAIPLTRVDYQNTGFLPPANMTWVRMTITRGMGEQQSIGSGLPATELHRYQGTIIFQIFEPSKTGTRQTMIIADDIKILFLAKTIGTIRTRTPYLNYAGLDLAFLQTNLIVPYVRDES